MNVLITGAASGIGYAVMEYFLNNNHTVFAIDICEISKKENLYSYVSDITMEEDLIKVKNLLTENNYKLDVIINIAGIHMMSSLIEGDYCKMKRLIDINLCGAMLVNKVFHSELNASGRIVILTSEVAGFDPMPFNGLYNVSKTGLDCYAQALRQELNLIGQKVITIRPGAIKTPLSNNSIKDTQHLANNTVLYQKQAKKFSVIASKFMGNPLEPVKLAKLIYKASTTKHPKLIYKIHHNIGLVLLNILPKGLQCKIIKMLLNH